MGAGDHDHDHDHEHVHEHDLEREHGNAGTTLRGWLTRAAWRFGGPWAAVTGVIATTSACPYCGNPQCVVGIGQAAGIGALTSGALWAINRFRGKQPDASAEPAAKKS